jgi:hypothetical protein
VGGVVDDVKLELREESVHAVGEPRRQDQSSAAAS